MIETRDWKEYTTEGDTFTNYALWPYKPAEPYAGKFRSINLLLQSFETAAADPRLFKLVSMIRNKVGISNTVWGVKHTKGSLGWEFYFYDYARNRRQIHPARPRRDQAPRPEPSRGERKPPLLHVLPRRRQRARDRRKDLRELHMYIGNPGSDVSSGICYSFTPEGSRLENFYFFFDAHKQLDSVLGKAACSAHVDMARIDIDQIVRPEFRECRTICIANKQRNDCIYFAGIKIDSFIHFLKWLHYPKETISFVEENRSMLDHLEYDVGFDYRMEGKELVVLKSGYYGIF